MKHKIELSHLSPDGRVRMVDVGAKLPTARMARARVTVKLGSKIANILKKTGRLKKGNVIEAARIAGIMAAKNTANLIPMCHPLPLDSVEIASRWQGSSLILEATAFCKAKTGVEMEALVAASVSALTVYDMCKSADKGIVISEIKLIEKTGGKSGHWKINK